MFHVVIPTIGMSDLLPALLHRLLLDGAHSVALTCNQHSRNADVVALLGRSSALVNAARKEGRVSLRSHQRSIYATWNAGMTHGVNRMLPVACLNDDIQLPPGSINVALECLPGRAIVGLQHVGGDMAVRRVEVGHQGMKAAWGTYRDGGVPGFAFVVDPTRCARVDPGFTWWYGDDDLVQGTLAKGEACVVAVGAPVFHPEPSKSGNQMPWIAEAIARDERLFCERWPEKARQYGLQTNVSPGVDTA